MTLRHLGNGAIQCFRSEELNKRWKNWWFEFYSAPQTNKSMQFLPKSPQWWPRGWGRMGKYEKAHSFLITEILAAMCLWQINPLSKFHATSSGGRRCKFTGTDKAIRSSLKIMKVFYLCDIFNVHLPPGKGQGDWLVPIKFMAHDPRRRSKAGKDWGESEDIYHQNKDQNK